MLSEICKIPIGAQNSRGQTSTSLTCYHHPCKTFYKAKQKAFDGDFYTLSMYRQTPPALVSAGEAARHLSREAVVPLSTPTSWSFIAKKPCRSPDS